MTTVELGVLFFEWGAEKFHHYAVLSAGVAGEVTRYLFEKERKHIKATDAFNEPPEVAKREIHTTLN